MPASSIGDRELALLHYIEEHEGLTVGEAATGFGSPRGLARSTVLTMMERLRGKGYLRRQQSGRTYQYFPVAGASEAMKRAVTRFVEKTLCGSVSPFVAWMAERGEVSDRELAELETLVAQLQTERKEG